MTESYEFPKNKYQYPENTAGGRKERSNLKGLESDIFGYPYKNIAKSKAGLSHDFEYTETIGAL